MLVKKFLVVLAASLLLVGSAFAASKSREMSIDANYLHTDGQTASLFNVSIGQLITPQFVIATSLSMQRNFVNTSTTIAVGGKYFFMDGFRGDLVPFVGGGIGLRLAATPTDSNHGSTQYEVNGGLAFFLTDTTTIDLKLRLINFNDSTPAMTWVTAGFSQRF